MATLCDAVLNKEISDTWMCRLHLISVGRFTVHSPLEEIDAFYSEHLDMECGDCPFRNTCPLSLVNE